MSHSFYKNLDAKFFCVCFYERMPEHLICIRISNSPPDTRYGLDACLSVRLFVYLSLDWNVNLFKLSLNDKDFVAP